MGGCQSKASAAESGFDEASPRDRAILDLKVQRDRLRRYQENIFVILDKERAIALDCLRADDKQRALFILRRKKYQERLLESVSMHLKNVEEMVHTIEFQMVQNGVFQALKLGNEVLRKLQDEISAQDLLEMSEQVKEANWEWDALMEPEVDRELEEELFDLQLAQVRAAEGAEKNAEVEKEINATEEGVNGTEEGINATEINATELDSESNEVSSLKVSPSKVLVTL